MEEIGAGVLTWSPGERVSDRYGTVYLLTMLDSSETVRLAKTTEGKPGRLIALVRETRRSRHIGDLFHGVFPKIPEVGQKVVLGEGTLFFQDELVGVRPDDGRHTQWLNLRALYQVHEQTVTLFFEELLVH